MGFSNVITEIEIKHLIPLIFKIQLVHIKCHSVPRYIHLQCIPHAPL